MQQCCKNKFGILCYEMLSLIHQTKQQNTKRNKMTNKTIKAGQTLSARSICDADCIFTVSVLDRNGNFATVKAQGNTRRVKVYADSDGSEYIYALGKYSMAPIFKAI